MNINLNLNSVDDYDLFLKIKSLPRFSFTGRTAHVPDEYVSMLGMTKSEKASSPYTPPDWMFDYQKFVTAIAIKKQKFAIFERCGLGKTASLLEFSQHAASQLAPDRATLIVSPLMVVSQTLEEAARFYGKSLNIEHVRSRDLSKWLASGTESVGITNYEALNDSPDAGRLGALVVDESSCMKSFNGMWAQELIRLGKGIDWKLALTGTPAPNDRIEYANHAVFLDRYPTVNSFLARFFVNRGQTQERWELKPHALRPFYRSLSDWCIFLNDPSVYGFKDNSGSIPPVHVHILDVPMTGAQTNAAMDATGMMIPGASLGGITSRSVMGQLAKGKHKGERIATNKPEFIRDLAASFSDRSTIIWCIYNDEQDQVKAAIPGCGSIEGTTKESERERIIGEFKSGHIKVLVSKAKVLGWGMNFQVATRHIFSGLQDSWEMFHQCISRSNRVGSTEPLEVYIPVTPIERAMVDTVIRKAHRIDEETREQEELFRKENIHAAT